MTRFLLVACAIIFIVACKPGIPKNIVQPDEMEKILLDIHIADGYVSAFPTPDSARKISAPIYQGIFKKYGIDSAIHAKSMAYYYRHPDVLAKMYDKITSRLGKVRDKEVESNEKEAQANAKKLTAEKAKEVKKDTAKKAVETKVDTVKKADTKKRTKIFKRREQELKN